MLLEFMRVFVQAPAFRITEDGKGSAVVTAGIDYTECETAAIAHLV